MKTELIATFFKKIFFYLVLKNHLNQSVLMVISQSDVEIVKISKYITEVFKW